MIHGPGRKEFTDQDWAWLAQIGAVPVLGFSFYSLETWRKLYELGFRECVVRLWHDQGDLPYLDNYLSSWGDYLRALVEQGWTVAAKGLNEPNKELNATPEQVRDWLIAWADGMKRRLPTVERVSPGLSISHIGAWDYLQRVRPAFAHYNSLGVHFYWATEADLQAGQAWSPEWWRGQFPDMPQRVTECGGGDDTTRAWRHKTYRPLLRRWATLDYVRSYHVYMMSSDDPHWDKTGHTYDETVVGILTELAREWRQRPRGETVWLAPGAVNLIGKLPTRAGAAGYENGPLDEISVLAVHYLGDPNPTGSAAGYGVVTPEVTARYQTGKTTGDLFPAIAYGWQIDPDGTLYQMHPVATVTWGIAGHNRHCRHVLLTGFGKKGKPTPKQLAVLTQLWHDLERHLGRAVKLEGHRFVLANSECPGDLAVSWLGEARDGRPAGSGTQAVYDREKALDALHGLWHHAEQIERMAQTGGELKRLVVALKEAMGLQ